MHGFRADSQTAAEGAPRRSPRPVSTESTGSPQEVPHPRTHVRVWSASSRRGQCDVQTGRRPPWLYVRAVWIRNTSRRPDDEVREGVLFAVQGIDMRRVCVNVKNGALGGAAYNGVPEISNAPRAARYLVTLRLGRGNERWPLGPINYHFKEPSETGPRNRFPFFVCEDWREWLVKLAAHEARHIAPVPGRSRSAARSTASGLPSSGSSSGVRPRRTASQPFRAVDPRTRVQASADRPRKHLVQGARLYQVDKHRV